MLPPCCRDRPGRTEEPTKGVDLGAANPSGTFAVKVERDGLIGRSVEDKEGRGRGVVVVVFKPLAIPLLCTDGASRAKSKSTLQ